MMIKKLLRFGLPLAVFAILVGIFGTNQNVSFLAGGNPPPPKEAFCDTHPNDAFVEMSERDFDFRRAERARQGASGDLTSGNIPVYFHVINQGTGIANGDIPDSQIVAQISTSKHDFFNNTGWVFVLAGIDRTTNATWFADCEGRFGECNEIDTLRQGSGRRFQYLFVCSRRRFARTGYFSIILQQ